MNSKSARGVKPLILYQGLDAIASWEWGVRSWECVLSSYPTSGVQVTTFGIAID
jgi:hypothetical protein